MAFLLRIEKGKNAGKELEVPYGEPQCIGRLPGSWLETDVTDRWVSGKHAEIYVDPAGQCLLTDVSTNGTVIFSRDHQETPLKGQTIALNDGDLIHLSSDAVLSVHFNAPTETVIPDDHSPALADRSTAVYEETAPMPPSQPADSTLVIQLGDGRRAVVAAGSTFVIGREHDCQLQISEDRSVSRKHCRIESEGGVFYLKNLSENGTFVQGEIILDDRVELKQGDQVVLTPGTHFDVAIQAQQPLSVPVTRTDLPPIGGGPPVTAAVATGEETIATTTTVLPSGLIRFDGSQEGVSPIAAAQQLSALRPIYAIIDFPKAGLPFPAELQTPQFLFNWLPDDVARVQSPAILTPQETERFYSLIEEAWNKDAVVCLFSQAAPPDVVGHLQRATGYSPSDPTSGLLGYFWPRILGTMLSSSNMPELKKLFSQVDAVLVESEDAPAGWSIIATEDPAFFS